MMHMCEELICSERMFTIPLTHTYHFWTGGGEGFTQVFRKPDDLALVKTENSKTLKFSYLRIDNFNNT